MAGGQVVGMAKKVFQDMFTGDRVMPHGNPQPIDHDPNKHKGALALKKKYVPYGPRIRTVRPLTEDD